MVRSSIAILSLAALISCDPKSEDNASSDPVEEEEEEEEEEEVGPTVEGTIEYLSTGEGGETVCDASIQFTGSNYTGDCETCDYSFMVNAELTDDRSGSDCEMLWQLSLLPVHDGQEDMLFGFTRSYQDIATNVLWTGYVGYYDYGYYDDGYYGDTGGFECSKGSKCQPMEDRWTPIAWDWSEEYAEYYQGYYQYYGYTPYNGGTATLVDGVISWSAYVNDGYNYVYAWFYNFGDDCDYYDGFYNDEEMAGAPATGFIGDGTLPCPAYSWGYDDYDYDYYDYYDASGESASDKAGLEWGVESPRGTTTTKSSSAADSPGSDWTWGSVTDMASGMFTHLMTWASSSDEDTGWWDDEGDTGDWGEEYRDSELVDVWTIDLSAGDEVLVTIDTLDDESGFDPGILVTGPDSCPLVMSDDNFNCTAGESDWEACPAVEFTADTDGTYHLIVETVECGETDEVTYQIGVDAPADPNLSLIEDDVLPYEIQTFRHEVTGTATITMPE